METYGLVRITLGGNMYKWGIWDDWMWIQDAAVPILPEQVVRSLAKRIRPVQRFVTKRKVATSFSRTPKPLLVPSAKGRLYFLRSLDLVSGDVTDTATVRPHRRAPKLEVVKKIYTYHWKKRGGVIKFSATVAEVIAQVPPELRDSVIAFEVKQITPTDTLHYFKAETTLYAKYKERNLPKYI